MIDSASAGLQPGTARELAGALAVLPDVFRAMAAGLPELAEWAAALRGVGGRPGDLIQALIPYPQQAATAAETCSARFRADNTHWLEGEDCSYAPAETLAEDVAEGFIPDGTFPAGFALADTLGSISQLAGLLAEELRRMAVWAEQELDRPVTGDQLGALAGMMTAMGQAADEARGTYHSANAFWLDARSHLR
jgi:hypothetical protein